MYKRILVPLDGSLRTDEAIRVAERLAEMWNADIEVISLMQRGDSWVEREFVVRDQIAGTVHVNQTTVRMVGYTIADEIADELAALEDGLVVMSTSARPRAGAMLGSVAEAVLQFVTEPLLLLGPNMRLQPDWPNGPMMVCTDGSATAEAIIPAASEWAKDLPVEPWVITVTNPSDAVTFDRAAEQEYPALVAKEMSKFTGARVDYDALHSDDPARAIVSHANGEGAALVAMSTHGRTGLSRLAMGSVAMRVVHDSACPVLVSRPG